MANIFSKLTAYATGWNLVSSRKLTQEEIDAVEDVSVVESEYGPSVCMVMKQRDPSGRKVLTYLPFGRDSKDSFKEGDSVNLNNFTLVELEQPGKDNIFRLEQ